MASPLSQLAAESAALLVIDPQNAFVHPEGTLGISGIDIAPAQAAMTSIRRLALQFKEAGLPVIWTQQVHLEHDASRARKVLASHTAKRKQVSALAGSWDAAFVDEVADLADDPTYIIVKHRFGAFFQTRLEELLGMLGVQTLFVTGVTANACVETTIREAYLRDYDVVAVTEGIAAVRPEWTKTAHEVWSHYLGIIASEQEVSGWLQTATQPGPRALHHLLLECSDLPASEAFYFDTLGFTERKREDFRDGRPFVATHQGLALVQAATPRATDGQCIEHICFSSTGIDRIAERARAGGHRIIRGPGPGPYGHTVYIADPDGNEIELFDAQ
ncbi:MAG: isochorismatase family protein [Beutenbergiaceae bacterium]